MPCGRMARRRENGEAAAGYAREIQTAAAAGVAAGKHGSGLAKHAPSGSESRVGARVFCARARGGGRTAMAAAQRIAINAHRHW